MGLIRGTEVEVARFAPMGDPMEIAVKGYLLSVRLSEASLIEIDSY
jgi:Fe2+ transport system protein FeoA